MCEKDIGSVIIADGPDLVGVVTDRDIVIRAIAEGGSRAWSGRAM
jgi:CBS domain-containing protein